MNWARDAWKLYKSNLGACFAIGLPLLVLLGPIVYALWDGVLSEGFRQFFFDDNSPDPGPIDPTFYGYLFIAAVFNLLCFCLGSKIVQREKIRFWQVWPGFFKFLSLAALWTIHTFFAAALILVVAGISGSVCPDPYSRRFPLVAAIAFLFLSYWIAYLSVNYLIGYARIASGERFLPALRACFRFPKPRLIGRLLVFSFILFLLSSTIAGIVFAAPFGAILVGLAAKENAGLIPYKSGAPSDDRASVPRSWPPAPVFKDDKENSGGEHNDSI